MNCICDFASGNDSGAAFSTSTCTGLPLGGFITLVTGREAAVLAALLVFILAFSAADDASACGNILSIRSSTIDAAAPMPA